MNGRSVPVQVGRLAAIPTAVIRRRVTRSDLPRVVPECCGLVWSALEAQGFRGGHNVALYRAAQRWRLASSC
jgi:hypothetical protein